MPWQGQPIIGLRKVNRVKDRFCGFIPVTNSARIKMIAPWFEEMGLCLAETAGVAIGAGRFRFNAQISLFPSFLGRRRLHMAIYRIEVTAEAKTDLSHYTAFERKLMCQEFGSNLPISH